MDVHTHAHTGPSGVRRGADTVAGAGGWGGKKGVQVAGVPGVLRVTPHPSQEAREALWSRWTEGEKQTTKSQKRSYRNCPRRAGKGAETAFAAE